MCSQRSVAGEGALAKEGGREGIRTAHELHASAQMTPGISNPWPLLV